MNKSFHRICERIFGPDYEPPESGPRRADRKKSPTFLETAAPALTIFICTLFMLCCFFAPQPGDAQNNVRNDSKRPLSFSSWLYRGRNTRIPRPSAALRDLDWLLGFWRLESELETMRWSVLPSSNGNFLVFQEELILRESNERFCVLRIVAWNPVSNLYDFSIFGSDGSFGLGRMENIGGEWMLTTRILLPDGQPASMTELFRPKGDGFVWRSISRFVAGAPLPDFGPLKAERIPPFRLEPPPLTEPMPAVLEADE